MDGTRRLNLVCMGHGEPTVIFDSGLSDWSFTWALVQPDVARTTRACAYDRAGLGASDPTGRPADSRHMVDDLHLLLQRAGVDGALVLVGHSMGALNVRLYAALYPAQVAGMVLVDPAHEDAFSRIDAHRDQQETRRYAAQRAAASACVADFVRRHASNDWRARCIEPGDPRYDRSLNAARRRVAGQLIYQRAQLDEITRYADGSSFAQLREARRSLGTLPLIVLTAQQTVLQGGDDWLDLHRELAAMSALGRQRTIANAGHYIQLDRPDVVIDAIAEVIRTAPRYHRAQPAVAPALATRPDAIPDNTPPCDTARIGPPAIRH
ncbi:abhydrolase, alpha/beta hydrolase fold-containing protein [Oxalobacteraceae bacterium IMCC9480]|nr:abhydrolase, alpha/beta hydrolase fold-containing protein [Oxalobacteraceae bacterium IMCC9480]